MKSFTASKAIHTVTRTCSVYLTIMITIHRLLVIAFPIKARAWLHDQLWQTRIAIFGVIVFSVLLNLPMLCKYTIVKNKYIFENSTNELAHFPYLTKTFGFAKSLPRPFAETLMAFDYFIPFPALVISKGLLYFKV